MKRKPLTISIAAALLLGAAGAANAHEGEGAPGERLGRVYFPVECNAAAQKEMNLAMAYYHSFAWTYVKDPIERVLQADPSCGMAHWARAMMLLDNPFAWPTNLPPTIYADGPAALAAARAAGLKSQRERDYVDALDAFFRDHDKLNLKTRAKAFES